MSGAETIAGALGRATRRLAASGIDQPRREAGLLVGHAIGAGRTEILLDRGRALDAEAQGRLEALLGRRCRREPIARILGRREFWSLGFAVTPATLDPRPDSETLVEAALATVAARDAPLRILDLGTGSGCLLLALLSELDHASGIGVDASADAVAVACTNAEALGLGGRAGFLVGDWATALAGPFDLIVVNPPYIPSGAIGSLAPEVARYEPRGALDGGADGLACYRALAPQIAERLGAGGTALVELGQGQAESVTALMAAAGLAVAESRADLAGRVRCLALRRAGG